MPELAPLTPLSGKVAQRALLGQAPAAERGAGPSCRSELITDCTPTGEAKVPRCFTAGLQERYRCAREPQGNLTLYDLIKSGQARSDPCSQVFGLSPTVAGCAAAARAHRSAT